MGLYKYCFWCEFEKDFLKASMGSLPNPVFLSRDRGKISLQLLPLPGLFGEVNEGISFNVLLDLLRFPLCCLVLTWG